MATRSKNGPISLIRIGTIVDRFGTKEKQRDFAISLFFCVEFYGDADAHSSTTSGTNWKVRQSTRPRLVRRRSGRQARGMRAMVMNGDGMLQPMVFQASSRVATSAAISSADSSFIRPAIGSLARPSTFPSATATMPPPQLMRVLAARAMSSSFVPTTSRL